MNQTKPLLGLCQECGAPISFPADMIGTMAQCPRCGKQTELFLAPAPEDSSLQRKGKVWAIIAAVILVLGLGGSLIGLKHFERWAAGKKSRAPEKAGFGVSAISLEKTGDGALFEAVGTLTNMTDRRRFGVKVAIDLLDAAGQRVGGVVAFNDLIAPRAEWVFRRPVSEPQAVSARLASIKEDR